MELFGGKLYHILAVAIVVHGNANHLQPCGTVALLKFDKPGDFLLAGRTPGGPEVEHHGLAAQIAELEVVPFKIGENKVGCGQTLGGDGRGVGDTGRKLIP